MFLASYAFAGPPHELVERFHRVMDACPDRAAFERFSSGEDLAQALRDVEFSPTDARQQTMAVVGANLEASKAGA